MINDKHTEIDLRITPIGGDTYVETHLFENNVMDADEADDYIGWKNEGNWIIQDAVYFSQYGMLDNYEVIRCEIFTTFELKEREIQKSKKKSKKHRIRKVDLDEIIPIDNSTLTEEEKVSVASANGIKWALNNSNRLANKKQKTIEEQWKDLGCNGFIKPNGEFVEVEWHIHYADDYLYDNDLYDTYLDIMDRDEPMGIQSPTEFLEHMGWVRIQGDRSGHQHYVENAYFKTINNTQLKVLNLICLKYKKKFDELVYNSEWMWQLTKK